jgi:LPS sulfotransferase NodH
VTRSSHPASVPRRSFVVITSQRTGSTLLVKSLDAADGVFCAGEIFHSGARVLHPEYRYPYLEPGRGVAPRIAAALLGRDRVRKHLARFYAQAGQGARAVGFKLMVSQAATHGAILPWLRQHHVVAILLYRRNAFDAALSYYRASVSGQFHSDRRGGASPVGAIAADTGEFRRLFDACRADRRRLLELRHCFGGLVLAYEDLIASWDASIAAVGATLGLPGLRSTMALDRLAAGELVTVTNEDSLRAQFVDDDPRVDTARLLSPNADATRSNTPMRG